MYELWIHHEFFAGTSRLLISSLSADEQRRINLLLFSVVQAGENVSLPVVQESKMKRTPPPLPLELDFVVPFDHSTANNEIDAKWTYSKNVSVYSKLAKILEIFQSPLSLTYFRGKEACSSSPVSLNSRALLAAFPTKWSSPKFIWKQMRKAAIHVRHEHLQ